MDYGSNFMFEQNIKKKNEGNRMCPQFPINNLQNKKNQGQLPIG